MTDTASNNGLIRIRGARQNNLKNIDLDLRTGDFTVKMEPQNFMAIFNRALLHDKTGRLSSHASEPG